MEGGIYSNKSDIEQFSVRHILERTSVSKHAYVELYKENNILVLDAGKYGFVKIQYYNPPFIFNDVTTFTDSKKLYFMKKAGIKVNKKVFR